MSQLTALLISIAIEMPVSALTMRLLNRPFYWRAAMIAAASTLVSHPFAWLANTVWLNHLPFFERAMVIEVGVVLFEAAFYYWLLPIRVRDSLLVSMLANAASFGAGLLIFM